MKKSRDITSKNNDLEKSKKERKEKDIEMETHIGYILYPQSEKADRLLLKRSPDIETPDDEFFDKTITVENGEFRYNGQKRKITQAGTFVDNDSLISIWKSSEKEPIEYKSPGTFSASDLKLLEREEITYQGIKNAAGGEVSGFGSSRLKSIAIVAAIAIAIFLLFHFMPSSIPILGG